MYLNQFNFTEPTIVTTNELTHRSYVSFVLNGKPIRQYHGKNINQTINPNRAKSLSEKSNLLNKLRYEIHKALESGTYGYESASEKNLVNKSNAISKNLKPTNAEQTSIIRHQHINSSGPNYVDEGSYIALRAACLSFIKLLYGEAHPYFIIFQNSVRNSYVPTLYGAVQILYQIKIEVQEGWLSTLRQLVTAEVFSNFMEMAEHLLKEGYKDAAAVMIGSTLEEHLRFICDTHNVEVSILRGNDLVPKKAETINADLRKDD